MLQFQVLAKDGPKGVLYSEADVIIKVKDVNDHRPIFVKNIIKKINITYKLKIGTIVTTVKATDKDVQEPNNRILYILKSGGHGKFHVDMDSGKKYYNLIK